MRIDAIEIRNFLSFDEFRWEGLGTGLNVIVGPNGAGKTNLFHAIRAVRDLLGYEQSSRWRRALVRRSTHRGLRDREVRFSLDLEFDSGWEVDLMRAFFAAALCEGDGNHYAERARLSRFLYESLRHLDITPFLYGRLVITCDPTGNWTSWYESRDPEFYWGWGLEGLGQGVVSTTADVASVPAFDALRSSYTGEPVSSSLGGGFQLVQPGDLKRFEDYLNGAPELPPLPDISSVIRGRNVRLEVRGQNESQLSTHREFARLAGLGEGEWHNQTWSGMPLLHLMLRRALVFTDNVRRSPKSTFSLKQLKADAMDLSNGEQLALHLYRNKMGDKEGRVQYEAVQQLFHRLTHRRFDVGAPYPVSEGTPENEIPLELRIDSEWGQDVPLEYAGAGRAEALFLSTLVASARDSVVLLDEPAQNLHPTVQGLLLQELQGPTGSQFLAVSHSPGLVPSDIRSISRFYTRGGATRRGVLASQIEDDERARIEKALRNSSDMKAMLFARGVVLVEGDTEIGALPIWYGLHFGYDPNSVDVVFHSVGGDKGFSKYVRFAEELGLPWVIVCDGPAIGDRGINGGVSRIADQLRAAGVDGLPDLVNEDFVVRREILSRVGVFTPVEGADQEIEALPGVREYLDEAKAEVSGGKVDRVRWVALNRPIPLRIAEVLDLIDRRIGR